MRTEVESTSVDESFGAIVVVVVVVVPLGRKRFPGLRLGTTLLNSGGACEDVSSVLLAVVVRMLGLRARIPANPLVVLPLGASVGELSLSGLAGVVLRPPGRRALIKLAIPFGADSEVLASVVVVRMLGRRISGELLEGFTGASVEASAIA